MSSDTDLIKLYSTRILAMAAETPFTERLATPDATVKRRSPLCGSTVTVDVTVTDGRISAYAQDVKACALGQAAASIAGHAIIGRSRAEVEAALAALKEMLKSDGPTPDAPFDAFEMLRPARDYKNRHASILLALEATSQAMLEAEKAHCA